MVTEMTALIGMMVSKREKTTATSLGFRAESDDVLRHHLQSAPRNAIYTSKTIQNELIHVVGTKIRCDILREVEQ